MGSHATRGRALGLSVLLVGCLDDVVETTEVEGADELGTSTSDSSSSDSTSSDSSGSESSDSTSSDITESSSDSSGSSEDSTEGSSEDSTGDSESDTSESESDSESDTAIDPICGNAIVEPGEACDDGENGDSTDACLSGCVAATCGDGQIWAGQEACDDGNPVDLDGCNLDCQPTKALIWERRIGEPGVCDYFHGVDVGASGLIVAVGSRDKQPAPEHDCQAIVHAFDTDGTPLWALELAGPAGACDQAWGVDVDDESRVYVTGHFFHPVTRSDQFVVAISPLGELLWQQVRDRQFDDFGYGLAIDALGQIAVAGATQKPDLDYDLALRVLDGEGSELWSDVLEGAGSAFGLDVAADQRIVVTGFTTTPGQAQDVFLREYGLDGTPLWTRTHDAVPHGNDRGGGVAIDGEGRTSVAGFVTGPSNHDLWIRRWDEVGDELWTQTWDDPNLAWADRGQDVAIDPQGHVIVAGQSWSAGTDQNSFDAWLGKYAADGQPIWLEQTSFPVDGEDVWFAVDVDAGDSTIVVAGATTTEAGACTDAVVRRYQP